MLIGHTNSITQSKFSSDEIYLLSSSKDNCVKLWKPSLILNPENSLKKTPLLKTYSSLHSNTITDIEIYNDNSKFITSSNDKSICLVDSFSSKVIKRYLHHFNAVHSIHLNEEFNILISGSSDMSAKIIDINSKDVIQHLKEATDSITTVNFNSKNNLIITSSIDGYLRIYDIRKNKLASINCHNSICDFDISFNSKYICVSCMNNTIHLIELETFNEISTFSNEHKCETFIMKTQFDPNDKGILTTSENGKIILYDYNKTSNCLYNANDNNNSPYEIITTCIDSKQKATAIGLSNGNIFTMI
jgi:mitogen-activated protein kinase organizer 1